MATRCCSAKGGMIRCGGKGNDLIVTDTGDDKVEGEEGGDLLFARFRRWHRRWSLP